MMNLQTLRITASLAILRWRMSSFLFAESGSRTLSASFWNRHLALCHTSVKNLFTETCEFCSPILAQKIIRYPAADLSESSSLRLTTHLSCLRCVELKCKKDLLAGRRVQKRWWLGTR